MGSGSDQVDVQRRTIVGMLAATMAAGAIGAHAAVALVQGKVKQEWPLWSLQNGRKKIYLMGETPPRPTDWHDVRVEQLLGDCAALWTETNQTYREPQKVLLQRFAMDPKRPLTSWLNTQDTARLRKAAAYCKVELADLAPYRPWCAAALLQDTYYSVSGAEGASADRVLSAQAATLRVPTFSEFPAKDDVFAWFGRMTPVQEVQFLRYTLDEILAGPAAGARIYDDWASGRPERAAAEVARYSRAYPDLAPVLTTQRNQQWLSRFRTMFAGTGTPLVIVGLYHMVGPSGLLALAQREGISVRRV